MSRWTSSVLLWLCAACSDQGSAFVPSRPDGPSECREAGCEDGVRLALVSRVFTPGVYSVATSTDEDDEVCSFVLGGPEENCDGTCLLDDDCGVTTNLGSVPHGVSLIVARDTPEVFDVVVLRNGRVLTSATLVPDYQPFAPAGSDCDPVCEVSSAQVDVP